METFKSSVVEWHYAPLTGKLMKVVDGVTTAIDNWSHFHEILNDFLDQKQKEQMVLKETVNYGHALFNGHSGRVDIYQNI